jgi:copper chaperone CopZ
MTPTELVLRVEGMSCGHCERAVTAAIKALDPAAAVAPVASPAQPDELAATLREVAAELREIRRSLARNHHDDAAGGPHA